MKPKLITICAVLMLLGFLCACSGASGSLWNLSSALAGDGTHHAAYAAAEADGGFHPDEDLTRADAAQLLAALLGASNLEGKGVSYSDVDAGAPYSSAISFLSAQGFLFGYPDGSFRPDASMSRGEFVALVCRIFGVEGAGAPLRDIPDDYWASGAIATAYREGWISGYPDGLFRPNAPITRAEAVSILNRAANRRADGEIPAPEVGYAVYTDVSASHWAYAYIMEASVDHDYITDDSTGEQWSNYEITVMGAKPGAQLIGGKLCYADPETLELHWFDQGFNLLDGALLYASEPGYAADQFPHGTVEFQGSMYYVQEDGSFLVDGTWGHLYFGPDGRYTSGDHEVDEMVEQLLHDLLADDSMTQEEKLYAAYCIIRDDGFKYATRGDVYDRGTSDWTLEVAKKFYKSQKGTCFYFTSGFMYLARRLGYDAYPVVGGVWSNNAYHSWVMISFPDGEEYIFDVELEWAYLHGHYSDTPKHYDLFKQPLDNSLFIYNFPN